MEGAATDSGDLYEPELEWLEKFAALLRDGPGSPGHDEETIRTLRHGLHTLELRHATFSYLSFAYEGYIEPLVDDLIRLATADRNTAKVRQLLARLTYQRQAKLVPPAVFRLLEGDRIGSSPVDYMDWRLMATVLYHLGLHEALRELCDRARDSIDEDIREVAEDFGDV